MATDQRDNASRLPSTFAGSTGILSSLNTHNAPVSCPVCSVSDSAAANASSISAEFCCMLQHERLKEVGYGLLTVA